MSIVPPILVCFLPPAAPACITTAPPAPPGADESPAIRPTCPPLFVASPLPTTSEIFPPLPPFALPVSIIISPELPELVVPDVIEIAPLTPSEPAFAVERTTAPDVVSRP